MRRINARDVVRGLVYGSESATPVARFLPDGYIETLEDGETWTELRFYRDDEEGGAS